MNKALRIWLKTEPDGTGELFIEFSTNGFSGKSSAWFELEKLKEQIKRFFDFPISQKNPPCIRGGYWNETATEIKQEHVYLFASQRGLTGDVVLIVRLATPIEENSSHELHYSASAELKISYQQLIEFAQDLNRLICGEIDEVLF